MRSFLVLLCVAAATSCASASAAPDGCAAARTAMVEPRALLAQTRVAYGMSVEAGLLETAAVFAGQLRAGERESERLLSEMYRACDVGRS